MRKHLSWRRQFVNRIRRGLGFNVEPVSLRHRLEQILGEQAQQGYPVVAGERHMLMNITSFWECRVDDVMVPRADIVAVEENTNLDALMAIFWEAGHSRLPVYSETLDDPVGMVHIKDVIQFLVDAPENGDDGAISTNFSLKTLVRRILFAPPSMPAAELLVRMQTARIHLTLVVDEYGGTDGLVSIEDLVEQIVGDIEDEHDDKVPPHLVRYGREIYADARTPIGELEVMMGLSLLPEDREEDIDTLGGLVVSLAGRVPQRGELVCHPAGFEIAVTDVDARRVKRLYIHLPRKDIPRTTLRQASEVSLAGEAD
ncbi:MAG: hemolysin family protein [Parvularculales bacterium]